MLADEYQNTKVIQYELLKMLAGRLDAGYQLDLLQTANLFFESGFCLGGCFAFRRVVCLPDCYHADLTQLAGVLNS